MTSSLQTQKITQAVPLNPEPPAAATVGVASAEAVAANPARTSLVLVNTSANYVSIAFGEDAVLYSGVTLAPNGVYVMDGQTFYRGAINAIASGANSNLGVQEFS